MFRLIAFALALFVAPAAAAQTPRDVLLDVCNDTGFSVAAAAAYRTSPRPEQTLRNWFLIQPGACLQGALNGVVGESLDLHVMSGSFRWPTTDQGNQLCVPAGSGLQFASAPPCNAGLEARNFRTLDIETSSRRGAGGRYMGRVSNRISCHDLSSEDAALCLQAPRDEQGLAQLVRSVEVCNELGTTRRIASFTPGPDGQLTAGESTELAYSDCTALYRGHPPLQRVLIGFEVPRTRRSSDIICWFENSHSASVMPIGDCPASATPMGVREAAFGTFTDSYTVFLDSQ